MITKRLSKPIVILLLAFSWLALSYCESSDSGSSNKSETFSTPSAAAGSGALTVSSKVSIVEAQDDSEYSGAVALGNESLKLDTRSVMSAISQSISTGSFAAASDYNTDRIDIWVQEESIQAFNTVNEILCSIDQSRYDNMLGLGDYRAQIDASLCSSDKDDASSQIQNSQNQSSANTKTEYENWTVNSSRVANQPHIIKVWVEEKARDEHDADKIIMAKMEIYQPSSTTNPFGFFKMNFIGYPTDANGNADTSQAPKFKGFMKTVVSSTTGATLLQFSNSMSMGSQSFSEQATFQRAADGSSGSGTLSAPVWSESSTPTNKVFNVAYNASSFLRQEGSNTAQCYDRTSFDKTVWDYSMYDNTGTRVQLSSGFPIKYTGGSKEYYGWVGYHGLWLPTEANIAHGDTVLKQNYNNGTTTEASYTVFIAGGRLMKHTKKTMALGDLKNVPLQWWNSGTNYRVVWTGSALQKTATLDQTNWTWTEITPVSLDLSSEWSFNFWSEALGGSGSFNLKNASNSYVAPSNTTDVVFHVQDVIYPTDTVPTNLVCFDQCPNPTALANTSATDLALSSTLINSSYSNLWMIDATPDASNYHQYTFSTSDMLLKYSSTSVVMTQANSRQPWGFHSGMMFEPTVGNLDIVKCDWNASRTCNFDGWQNMPVYYTWETGPETWNKFTAIKDGSNNFAKFDPPKKVTYTHSQTNSSAYDYKYNGVKFNLEYSGFGNLHGIPGRCINKDTGENTACGSDVRWIPEFNISPGSTVVDVGNGTTEYVVKPLHVEQRMSNVSLSNCSSISLVARTLPSITDWVDPAIGAKPTVTGAPAVIGGELQ